MERIKELTDEQLNIAICEWRGWRGCTDVKCEARKASHLHKDSRVWYFESYTIPCCRIPNHITGIEALGNMHEAEKGLDGLDMDTRSKWLDHLALECEWPKTKNAADLRFETQYLTARATARQRAIALLRVVKPELFQ